MIMVSEMQSGNLSGSSLQSLHFPSMDVNENIVKKKLKIKICASKKVDGEQATEYGHRVIMNNKCGHSSSVNGNKKSQMNKSQNFVICSSAGSKLHAADSLKVKLTVPCSSKHGPSGMVDDQMLKKRKIDCAVKQQCTSIVKTLMNHRSGWVFNKPVDPVAYNIPDYFSIISKPMDLGTIKTKLEGNVYFSVDEFEVDVRLTFSNAMLYNPPSNNVHHMAKELDNVFSRRWKLLEAKWDRESKNVEQSISSGTGKNNIDTMQAWHKKFPPPDVSRVPKMSLSPKEKQKKRKVCVEASKDSLGVRAAKVEPAKGTKNGGHPFIGEVIHKDTGSRSACGSANTEPPLSSIISKCGLCDSVICQCKPQSDYIHASFINLSSERSLQQDHGGSLKRIQDCEVKNMPTAHTSKSDPDSDGAVTSLDEGNICSSPHISTFATSAAYGEGSTPIIDVQLSPKKALRAAMLKSRFADTIFKAKHKTLPDHGGKADPVKLQQERERLERLQREEKARIEAQIRAAEAASRLKEEAELKMQREKEREAARIAVQKIEKTVDINDNVEILKDLELLSQYSMSDNSLDGEDGSGFDMGAIVGGHSRNLLERLGLYIKEEYMVDEDEEEGEIFS